MTTTEGNEMYSRKEHRPAPIRPVLIATVAAVLAAAGCTSTAPPDSAPAPAPASVTATPAKVLSDTDSTGHQNTCADWRSATWQLESDGGMSEYIAWTTEMYRDAFPGDPNRRGMRTVTVRLDAYCRGAAGRADAHRLIEVIRAHAEGWLPR